MTAQIYKKVFTTTLLCDTPNPPGSLDELAAEMDVGGIVGICSQGITTPVPSSQVARELRALGNDGGFFGDEFLEAEDSSDEEPENPVHGDELVVRFRAEELIGLSARERKDVQAAMVQLGNDLIESLQDQD